MVKIRTSEGFIEEFDENKIVEALTKDAEFLASQNNKINIIDGVAIKKLAKKVTKQIAKMEYNPDDILASDTIRGLVVSELLKLGEFELSNIVEVVGLNITDTYGILTGSEDHDNANLTPNPETSHKLIADNISKKYYIRMLLDEISKAHISGDIHIHDLEYFGTRPFCRSWDLRRFFMWGFSPDSEDTGITALPPKHAEVAILQACKVLAMGQCNHAGGQGLLYGTVFLAPYMKDKSYSEIKQLMQMMLYELNQMYISRGGQVIFSSINISPGVPKVLENVAVVHAGKIHDDWKYGELEREVRLMFRALMELSLEGDSTGKLFPFPKLEVSIEKKFIETDTTSKNYWRNDDVGDDDTYSYHDLYKLAFEVTAKYGILYFDNLLVDGKSSDSSVGCTQCCSYSFKTDEKTDSHFDDELNFKDGYFFRLGGMQAVSINLPRLAYRSDHAEKKLISLTFDAMDLAVKVFVEKKKYILSNVHRLKFLTQQTEDSQSLTDFDSLVYEIGIVGLNEVVQYMTGHQLGENDDTLQLGKHLLHEMNKYCNILSQMHNITVVLARTPAETVAQRFAVCDLTDVRYQDVARTVVKGNIPDVLNGDKNISVYYSNGFAPWVGSTISIFEKLNIESELWQFVDGGAITHVWLGEETPDVTGLMDFAMNIFRNTNIGYLAFTKDMSQCSKCKRIINGLVYNCECGSKDLTWYSRITGYYSIVGMVRDGEVSTRWNAAKRTELVERHRYDVRQLG